MLREEMAEERRRLKEEHAADKEARRLARNADMHHQLEPPTNGQVRPQAAMMSGTADLLCHCIHVALRDFCSTYSVCC